MINKSGILLKTHSHSLMETIAKPSITVSFQIDIDLEFDSFKGKTPEEFAQNVEDDAIDALLELRPEVLGVFTTINNVETHGC